MPLLLKSSDLWREFNRNGWGDLGEFNLNGLLKVTSSCKLGRMRKQTCSKAVAQRSLDSDSDTLLCLHKCRTTDWISGSPWNVCYFRALSFVLLGRCFRDLDGHICSNVVTVVCFCVIFAKHALSELCASLRHSWIDLSKYFPVSCTVIHCSLSDVTDCRSCFFVQFKFSKGTEMCPFWKEIPISSKRWLRFDSCKPPRNPKQW